MKFVYENKVICNQQYLYRNMLKIYIIQLISMLTTGNARVDSFHLNYIFVPSYFWISRYCCITFQGIIGFQFLFMLPQESIFSSLEHFYLRIIWQRSLGLHSKHTKLINFLMWQRWRKINISNTIPTECPFIFTTLKCHIPIWLYGSVQ